MKRLFTLGIVGIVVALVSLSACSQKSESGSDYEKAMKKYVDKTYYGMSFKEMPNGEKYRDELAGCWATKIDPLLDSEMKEKFIKNSNNKDATADLEYDYGLDAEEVNKALDNCTKKIDKKLGIEPEE